MTRSGLVGIFNFGLATAIRGRLVLEALPLVPKLRIRGTCFQRLSSASLSTEEAAVAADVAADVAVVVAVLAL